MGATNYIAVGTNINGNNKMFKDNNNLNLRWEIG